MYLSVLVERNAKRYPFCLPFSYDASLPLTFSSPSPGAACRLHFYYTTCFQLYTTNRYKNVNLSTTSLSLCFRLLVSVRSLPHMHTLLFNSDMSCYIVFISGNLLDLTTGTAAGVSAIKPLSFVH